MQDVIDITAFFNEGDVVFLMNILEACEARGFNKIYFNEEKKAIWVHKGPNLS